MSTAVGLDIGSTRTKFACVNPKHPDKIWLTPSLNPTEDERPFTLAAAQDLATTLSAIGFDRVGVTGAGADTFAAAAKELEGLTVAIASADPFEREIAMQLAGVRSLCRRADEPLPDEFTLIGIGTGVSYTHAFGDAHRAFPVGNPIGGGFMLGASGLSAEEIAEFGKTHSHGDLLMEERFPHLTGSPLGKFVLASYGNMGRESLLKPPSTAAKCVATQVVRDLMLMQLMPAWTPVPPFVFVGTPVDRYEVLRGWLSEYCEMLRMPHRYVQDSAYAGALGAYELACKPA